VKDKESQLKASEQKLHDEFERMRKQHTDEKKQLDDKRVALVRIYSHICVFLNLLYHLGG